MDTERPTTQEIIEQLYQNHLTQPDTGVAIHGYNTGSASGNQEKGWQGWYQPLCDYANTDRLSQLLLYRLVFLVFPGLLDSLLQTSPEELGLQALPEELQTEFHQIRAITAPGSEVKKRRVALKYLSWLCQQKQIQTAVSPERY